MDRIWAKHSMSCATENMAGTVIQSDSNSTDPKPQPHSKTMVNSSLDTKGGMEPVLAYIREITKTDFRVIVETRLTRCTSALQSQIMKFVESTIRRHMTGELFY